MITEERLALVQLKIERAKKHVIELDGEISAFFSTRPYEVRAKRNLDTRQLVYYLHRVADTPRNFAVIAGDVIHNLRSALDHLAQQLYIVGSGGNTAGAHIYFPIGNSAREYEKIVPEKIKGLRKDAVDVFGSIEPYKGGKGHDLWVLNRLANTDKHRLLVTVISQFGGVNVGSFMWRSLQEAFSKVSPGKAVPKFDLYLNESNQPPLKAGYELFIDAPDTEVKEDMDFRFVVAIHEPGIVEGKPISELLKHLADLVDNTVSLFKLCLE